MLPLQQAYEVKQSIIEYLKATFTFKEKKVSDAFYNFIEDPKEGIFKGPYVSLKLPFETAQETEELPLDISPNFPPYKHQHEAFKRLHTNNGHLPQATLLTTGTGSGKTESFLFPILDYCFKHKNERGVKVIILYPMNALATDQAKRLAEAIYEDDRLRGAITAGLFIGEGKDKSKFPKNMGETHIIENRDEIIANPPDILLTNFKMLDYGLMRHNFHKLWSHNFDNPELLRFLVLDELHTYDGAQGTDVANLIRRLKLKLNIPKDYLCPIGTSATIGKGEDSVQLLTKYATDVFGETFTPESVIIEHRLSPNQFFTVPENELDAFIPRIVGLQQSRLGINENYYEYIVRQKKLWQLPETMDPYNLSKELKKLKVVKDISSACSDNIVSVAELIKKIDSINPIFEKLPSYVEDGDFAPKEEIITSILALIAEAKSYKKGRFPFLFLQIQIWVRELSGLLREFNEEPTFTWRDKIAGKDENAALPPYFCRECGASGWLAIKHDNRNQFEPDPLEVYDHYFTNHKNIYLVNTNSEAHKEIEEYAPTTTLSPYVHQVDLKHHDHIADRRMHMLAYRRVKDKKSIHTCPECNSTNELSIIGTRIATLNSISVSQVLASDLDERGEKYRKVLAFTNGVQDAAHHAGFVQARNYRFTFRASLQKVINSIGAPTDLNTLKNKFIEYWKSNADPSGANHLESYYYRFFPSDYIGKAEVEDYRNSTTNEFSKAFEKEFDERIGWEIISEFGYNAAIGRTLEKTGSSAVSFNQEQLEEIFDALENWMQNNMLESIDKATFVKFLNAILHRMRIRGAVDHEYLSKFRTKELKLWDLNWTKDSRHFLNRKYHPKSRIPKLVGNKSHTRGVLDTTFAKTTNWYHRYFLKSFSMVPNNNAIINEFYELLFDQLSSQEILSQQETNDGGNYAILAENIIVSNKVSNYNCNTCSSIIHVTEDDKMIEGASCLDYKCSGKYQKAEVKELNYYNLVYNRANAPRIYASEHTGILERKVREATEYDFKERPKFNSLNTLVATSTLEMGIDVGSLNTAINTSIPPLPSNFLQRIGRAGRSSGTALIENFAQNKAHDLFYYAEPLEMMEGDINTPGCFLNAKDILVRHFTAYCFDSWTKQDPEVNQIPGLIKTLKLLTTKTTDKGFFINQLLDFVFENQKELFSAFEKVYEGQIDESLIEDIKTSLQHGAFQQKLINVFDNLRNEFFFLKQKEKEIEDYIKEKKLGKEDKEGKELDQEKRALWQLKKALELRQVIEHLTNVGILPNYAFPETGVTLNAHVFGFKPEGAEQEPMSKSYEIVRSATGALKEFAPDNFFYSQGNKLEISGLNTFDWSGQKSSLSTMRFCSNCDHLEDELLIKEKGSCPKCDHESWNSATNKHKFARLQGVKSVNSRSKSALNDSKDEREQKNYKISTHFKFNPKSIEGTWGMTKIPFGIEYVKDVEITKVNLGAGVPNSSHLSINQIDEVARHGFVTCKSCGKSTSKPREVIQFEQKKFHYGYCKHKEEDYNNVPNDIFEEVFLYRNVKTEAIKILLPVQEFLNEATQQMFKSGLELGLKKYYKGNPDHIAFEFYSEYNTSNDRFDRYLIAYDTIPGGTGYLQKIFDPKEFTEVLKEAYDAIKSCSCKNQGKDGCYRCILSYGNQYIREDLSRESAEELFGRIVRSAKEWEEVNQGISSLTKTGMIEESELELKFIYALKKYANKNSNVILRFDEFKENGINTYRITLPIKDGQITYLIRPQFNLGEKDGLVVNTRTDFYFKCIELQKNGEIIDDVDALQSYKDVAIYLDGYTYHASEKHMRFYNDIEIRNNIAETPNIASWSLSWNDVRLFEAEKEEDRIDGLFPNLNRYSKAINLLNTLPITTTLKKGLLESKNSIERLLWYLTNSSNKNTNSEVGLFGAAFQEQFAQNSFSEENANKMLQKGQDVLAIEKTKPSGETYMLSDLTCANELYKAKILVRVKDLKMISSLEVSTLDTIEKSVWEEFLQLYSLMKLIKK
ncbi:MULTISPECIES: DEAD/DEAH box helicase [Flavobacteriaceae]|uniref:DEAD/DEAH box helicase n=2 Tax=Flavobacteriaceae TaxID=49546 RepID=A0A4Y8AUT3_9FLAO|nr:MULTISPECIES: DEAD/DEAH box helicase [Flavobacteriaceae]TEW75130.1 DEAD/DEAH box helicase [Gramella jeungdoensis]GGK41323.1 DEAD/DEAH box helicase [Lutibacter litoralis]